MTHSTADSGGSVPDDIAASQLASVVSIVSIEEIYGDDSYGDDDVWAERVPDLGENQ